MVYVIDSKRGQNQQRSWGGSGSKGSEAMLQHNISSDSMSSKTMRGGQGFGSGGGSGSVLIQYLVIKSYGGRGGGFGNLNV
ncbi:unnamed protein product [Anisakis simplex]|uniref:Heterogeneous nuclear ribonucleoprotein A1 n=1 Tax=Anisakis simplex TaxID=6269 RepID=A0A0M3JZ39_ANISI|nr:unnamed protein product [Anisakis simplex]